MLNYIDEGRGEALLFIHGYLENHTIWNNYVDYFSDHYRVIAVDLPGFGESPFYEEEISLEELAKQLNTFLSELGIQKVTLIGHSLGGYVSLAFLELNPEVITNIVLLNSTTLPDSLERKKLREKGLNFINEKGLSVFVRSFVPPLFVYARRQEMKMVIDIVKKMALEVQENTFVAYTNAMKNRKGYLEVLQNISKPMLVVSGEEDVNILPLDLKAQIKVLPQANLQLISNAGHMSFLEEESRTIELINEFLN